MKVLAFVISGIIAAGLIWFLAMKTAKESGRVQAQAYKQELTKETPEDLKHLISIYDKNMVLADEMIQMETKTPGSTGETIEKYEQMKSQILIDRQKAIADLEKLEKSEN